MKDVDKRLAGKTALVTGAGTGIGREIALLFARHGARLGVNIHQSMQGGRHTVQNIEEQGGEAVLLPGDVSKPAEVREMIRIFARTFGGIDILVNNSGIGTTRTPDRVTDIDVDEWDRVLEVNLKGAMLTAKCTIPFMQERGGGKIVNVASIRGLLGNPVLASYCASKGGMVLLTKQMALDYAADNIRVNCVCPGFTETEMLKTYLQKQGDPIGAREAFTNMAPLRRMGTPEEIAYCALFFASDESSFITGVALPADGGYTANGIRVIQ
jgi:NAD(P)-dependent dehydrogenase (short-subunit alcohol dehydrogenase family)